MRLHASDNLCTRVCADDVGCAISNIKSLHKVKAIFVKAECLAGLALKPSKCNLIPLAEPFSSHVKQKIQNWLDEFLPDWKHFSIVPVATYLGFSMGPMAFPSCL